MNKVCHIASVMNRMYFEKVRSCYFSVQIVIIIIMDIRDE